TEHGAGFGDGVVIHRKIDFFGRQKRTGTAARDYGFELFAVGNAARDFVDKLLHVHAEWNFVNTGLVDMAGDAKEAGAAILGRAAVGVSFASFANDVWYGTKRFNVINDCGGGVETEKGRGGGFNWRIAGRILGRVREGGL